MTHRLRHMLLLAGFATGMIFAQGNDTTASKDDWEEINFEVRSSTLSDGYPSLLRLADLLKQQPGYRVKLVGHGDPGQSARLADKLGAERANAVKAFLVKYGASPNQINVETQGNRSPKVSGRSPESRFMSRRVEATVTDPSGKVVGEGSVGDAITTLQKQLADEQARNKGCCDDLLKKLDKLDEIAAMLQRMQDENANLRKELEAMRTSTSEQIAALPKPLTSNEVTSITERSTEEAFKRERMPRFSLMGLNAGVDDSGNLTFTGKGRYFAPFRNNFALQAQGEYMYWRDRKEGQFDAGLVYRLGNVQAGLFSSFKHVTFNEYQNGGTLGQGALAVDYLFSRGKIGVFGTKAFLDNRVLNRQNLTNTLAVETLLKAVDQIGAQTTLALVGNTYLEGNLGYLKSYGAADRPGGTLRFVFPINDNVAFTLEGGLNETLLGRENYGRVVAGVQLGNFLRPKEFQGVSHPVPVDVPRVRYELITRRIRTGNEAPIADAGPDQTGRAAGQITLDGSNSSDPEGDPLTFQWIQTAGPAISLAGANTSRATFTATEGQSYSFRLTVADDKGASSIARVNVTTARTPEVRILRFVANPGNIRSGESAQLNWAVDNADEVTIDGIGRVDARSGSTSVSPTQTTSYRLTAKNSVNEVSETVTVVVQQPQVRIVFFQASPMTVVAGQSSTLAWQTEGADSVEITGVGAVAENGTQSITPTATTTYVLTARNRFGQATAQVSVQVNPAPMPRIIRFTAAPSEIVAGEQASLVWQVENATDVSISTVGEVALTGSTNVTPTTNTTYLLTARNVSGEVTAEATVGVFPAVRIISFTATPAASASPGAPVVLSWTTEGANEVFIDGVGSVNTNGTVTVNPRVDTAYTIRAIGRRNTVTQRVQVTVGTTPGQGNAPIANAGPNQVTTDRNIRLDGTRSFHPEGLVIGYSWRALGRQPELILGGDTATPTVRFAPLAFGEYEFELTVTDSTGRFSKATTKVFFGAY